MLSQILSILTVLQDFFNNHGKMEKMNMGCLTKKYEKDEPLSHEHWMVKCFRLRTFQFKLIDHMFILKNFRYQKCWSILYIYEEGVHPSETLWKHALYANCRCCGAISIHKGLLIRCFFVTIYHPKCVMQKAG